MDTTPADRILVDADERRRIELLRQLALLHGTPAMIEAWGRAEAARQWREQPTEDDDAEIPF